MSYNVYTHQRYGLTKEDVLSFEWKKDFFDDWYNSGSIELYTGKYTTFTGNGLHKHELSDEEWNYLKLKLL